MTEQVVLYNLVPPVMNDGYQIRRERLFRQFRVARSGRPTFSGEEVRKARSAARS